MALSTMGTRSGRTAFFFPVGEDDVVKKGVIRRPSARQRYANVAKKKGGRKDPTGLVAKL
jgi:hypothetical protein